MIIRFDRKNRNFDSKLPVFGGPDKKYQFEELEHGEPFPVKLISRR
jgi:hypothetical protein